MCSFNLPPGHLCSWDGITVGSQTHRLCSDVCPLPCLGGIQHGLVMSSVPLPHPKFCPLQVCPVIPQEMSAQWKYGGMRCRGRVGEAGRPDTKVSLPGSTTSGHPSCRRSCFTAMATLAAQSSRRWCLTAVYLSYITASGSPPQVPKEGGRKFIQC